MDLLSQQKELKPSLVIPKPVVFLSRSVHFFSSRLAIRLAAKMFTTPINFKTPKRELAMAKSAQKKELIVGETGKRIHLLSYGYSKKKVLLVHGWAGRSTQLFAFADKLLEKGYMVISFDGPAHGKSSGKTTDLLDFLATIKQIDKEHGPFEAAIGHSFGGISLYNAVSDFLKIKTFVTIGAGDKVSNILVQFIKNLKLNKSAYLKLQQFIEKKWGVLVDDYASGYVASNIDIPVLVIHDTEDGDVPVSNAYNIRQNLQNGSLLITHGLGHTKILRDQNIVNKTVEHIIQNT
ncbi:alpha/beta hydrolase [Flavobacteriaceae bacterium S356]|uniref:Alpha/beta hydrolase n=1 Tax=Asprobacillus argus TaxID=3076534 RepID=A0ABU3LEH4_9FLAO|nr:alpha/beta hydrolase [Flavobacteriaceae bacterium S356]